MGGEMKVPSIEPPKHLAIRGDIFALEKQIAAMPQAEMPVRHFFSGGLYARELSVPKNCVLTGAIHKHDHISILTKGHMIVASERGLQELRAGDVLTCKAGTKRAGFAYEDSVFICLHATEATTPEAAEADLVTNDYAEYELFLEQQCRLQSPVQS